MVLRGQELESLSYQEEDPDADDQEPVEAQEVVPCTEVAASGEYDCCHHNNLGWVHICTDCVFMKSAHRPELHGSESDQEWTQYQ